MIRELWVAPVIEEKPRGLFWRSGNVKVQSVKIWTRDAGLYDRFNTDLVRY